MDAATIKKIEKQIPKEVRYLFHCFEHAGFQLFLVGGCVRNIVAGKPVNDWDLCTNASPEQMIKLIDDLSAVQDNIERIYRPIYSLYGEEFKKVELKTIPTGIKHGTVTVVVDGTPFEITTYRCDGEYSDGRHPDSVSFTNNLIEDLKRRDFTMNAIAYNPSVGFVDPFGGVKDIRSHYVRCVGNPNDRLHEDGLRVLRAIRFAAQMGYMIEAETARAVHSCKNLLENISVERIQSELCKILSSKVCGNRILDDFSDVICVFIPEIKPMIGFEQNNPWHSYDVWGHTLACMGAINSYSTEDINTRLSILFHDIGKPFCYSEDDNGVGHFYGHAKVSAEITESVMRRLRFSNEIVESVVELVKSHDIQFEPTVSAAKKALNRMGDIQLFRLIQLRLCDIFGQNRDFLIERANKINMFRACVYKVLEDQSCFKIKDLAVNGNDLMEIGIPEGKDIGLVLSHLLNVVIDGEVENNKDELIQMAKEFYFDERK